MDINNVYAQNQRVVPASVEDKSEEAKVDGTKRTIAQETRAELNASILAATAEVNISAGNKPLHLLFASAIEKLNELLAPELGENAIQQAAKTPDEFTPEKTAERIVSLTTGFFASYSEQHPEMSQEEQLNSFLEVIGSGIDQGFSEARGILTDLSVLDGDIADGVDKTYELVQQGLEAFRETIMGSIQDNNQDNSVDEVAEVVQPE
jgi:hypothetical protein